jgi:hypothetical protein
VTQSHTASNARSKSFLLHCADQPLEQSSIGGVIAGDQFVLCYGGVLSGSVSGGLSKLLNLLWVLFIYHAFRDTGVSLQVPVPVGVGRPA